MEPSQMGVKGYYSCQPFSGVFAIVCYATVHSVVLLLTPAVALLGFGDIPIEFVFGIFFMSAVFTPYILRKPGVATIVGLMTALIQVLMGSAFSSTVIVSGLVQGLGAELIFFLFRYKKWDWSSMLLAAASCCVFSFVLAWYRGLWMELAFGFVATRFVIRLISALVFSGVLAKILADRLAKAGVLKSYPIGKKYAGAIDEH